MGRRGKQTAPTLSAGVVVVRRTDDGSWRVLLLRAYKYWDCPKGIVEPGEDPLAAARREVREETGIDDLVFTWGECFVETAPYSNNKIARYYIAETRTAEIHLAVNPELGAPEHHEFRWSDFDTAATLTVERVRKILEWARAQAR